MVLIQEIAISAIKNLEGGGYKAYFNIVKNSLDMVDMCEAGFWSFGSNRIGSESVIRFMERITTSDLTFGSNQYRIESLLD